LANNKRRRRKRRRGRRREGEIYLSIKDPPN